MIEIFDDIYDDIYEDFYEDKKLILVNIHEIQTFVILLIKK